MQGDTKNTAMTRQSTVSAHEAAILLGVSSFDVHHFIDCGDIDAAQLDKRWVIPTAEVERLLKQPLAQETISWARQAARIKYRTG